MTDADTKQAAADDGQFDPDYDIGIEEGHRPPPIWMKLLFGILAIALVIYFGRYFVGAQPSSSESSKSARTSNETSTPSPLTVPD